MAVALDSNAIQVEVDQNMIEYKVTLGERDLFIPTYREPWNDIQRGADKDGNQIREFWFKGGRASFKSTFICEVIALGMMDDARKAVAAKAAGDPHWKRKLTHAVVYRKYGVDIKDSTFETFRWVVTDVLGYGGLWEFSGDGRKAKYLPTGQLVLFRGLDDPEKSKSIKAPFGIFKYLWFEELTQYKSYDEIRSVGQSVKRGGHGFQMFCSYNPPMVQSDWVNTEALKHFEGRKVYHSTFLDAAKYAPQWLGSDFFRDAKALLADNEKKFRHEYLGEITGTGAEVFTNVRTRTVTDADLANCICKRQGLDFGFENDPCALVACALDAKRKILYIYDEWVKAGQFEEQIYKEIERRGWLNRIITADCAEEKAIRRLNNMGARKVQKCTKGPNSVIDGLHWLRGLRQIIIDPVKCPVATHEFTRYEWKFTRAGVKTNEYVDADNHTIDAVRYALETEIRYGDAPHRWGIV